MSRKAIDTKLAPVLAGTPSLPCHRLSVWKLAAIEIADSQICCSISIMLLAAGTDEG